MTPVKERLTLTFTAHEAATWLIGIGLGLIITIILGRERFTTQTRVNP